MARRSTTVNSQATWRSDVVGGGGGGSGTVHSSSDHPSASSDAGDGEEQPKQEEPQLTEAQKRRLQRTVAEAAVFAEKRRKWFKKHHPEKYAAEMRELARKRDMKAWFDFLDTDGSGEIDQSELEDPLMSLGLATRPSDVAALIATVDEDGTGEIGFEEFLQVVTRQEPGKENPLAKLYRALAAGELGDPILHLSVLIAAYRRRMVLHGLSSYAIHRSKKTAEHKRNAAVVRSFMDTLIEADEAAAKEKQRRQEAFASAAFSVLGTARSRHTTSFRSTATGPTASKSTARGIHDSSKLASAGDMSFRSGPHPDPSLVETSGMLTPHGSASFSAVDSSGYAADAWWRDASATGVGTPAGLDPIQERKREERRRRRAKREVSRLRQAAQEAEQAVFEEALLRRHGVDPHSVAMAPAAATATKLERHTGAASTGFLPDLRDYDVFKHRGSNKPPVAIIHGGLPRFSRLSVAERLLQDKARTETSMASQTTKGRQSRTSGTTTRRSGGSKQGSHLGDDNYVLVGGKRISLATSASTGSVRSELRKARRRRKRAARKVARQSKTRRASKRSGRLASTSTRGTRNAPVLPPPHLRAAAIQLDDDPLLGGTPPPRAVDSPASQKRAGRSVASSPTGSSSRSRRASPQPQVRRAPRKWDASTLQGTATSVSAATAPATTAAATTPTKASDGGAGAGGTLWGPSPFAKTATHQQAPAPPPPHRSTPPRSPPALAGTRTTPAATVRATPSARHSPLPAASSPLGTPLPSTTSKRPRAFREVDIPTYSEGSSSPHVTTVRVPEPVEPQPSPPRSASPTRPMTSSGLTISPTGALHNKYGRRVLSPSERTRQAKHMSYLELQPKYRRDMEKRTAAATAAAMQQVMAARSVSPTSIRSQQSPPTVNTQLKPVTPLAATPTPHSQGSPVARGNPSRLSQLLQVDREGASDSPTSTLALGADNEDFLPTSPVAATARSAASNAAPGYTYDQPREPEPLANPRAAELLEQQATKKAVAEAVERAVPSWQRAEFGLAHGVWGYNSEDVELNKEELKVPPGFYDDDDDE